jgi:aminocarboxymuconate-semialdehyde decarboxylase
VRIDAFAHVLPDRYRERVLRLLRSRGDQAASDYELMLGSDSTLVDLGERFELMDEIGPDYRQILVMAHTSAEHGPPDAAAELARIGNVELAELVAAHPDRFAGWVAQVALQDGERGLAALEQAIANEGALGAQVFTSIQGRALDHPDYEPFFALMARLDRPVWIHPNRTVQWSDYPLSEPESLYGLYSRAGWPTDTTVAMCRLVYAGYLERWPDLKIVVHHSGGTVPMLAGRLRLPPAARGGGGRGGRRSHETFPARLPAAVPRRHGQLRQPHRAAGGAGVLRHGPRALRHRLRLLAAVRAQHRRGRRGGRPGREPEAGDLRGQRHAPPAPVRPSI